MKLCSCSMTYQNSKLSDKPNEDYFICDDERHIYILVDGVSRDKIEGRYPNPSPARDVSEIFAHTVYEYLRLHAGHTSVMEAVGIGNCEIAKYNEKIKWENDFLPGTVGIVAIIEDRVLYYCYIGDCYGLKISQAGEKYFFTECQTNLIARYGKKFTAYEIRNKICNHKEHPYSYGVLNGDVNAMDFVVSGRIEIDNDEKIILCSDGFDDLVKNYSGTDLYKMSLEEMERKTENKDDKTVIVIE